MRILITAGPTQEPIDAVRVLSNRPSGRLGVAVAARAAEIGHDVTLLLGQAATATPPATATCHRFETTADLQQLLEQHFPDSDVPIMAAAVSHFLPEPAAAGTNPSR